MKKFKFRIENYKTVEIDANDIDEARTKLFDKIDLYLMVSGSFYISNGEEVKEAAQ